MNPNEAMSSSPFQYADAAMNSFTAMGVNVASDFMIDKIHYGSGLKELGLKLGDDGTLQRTPFVSNTTQGRDYVSSSVKKNISSAGYDAESKTKHFFRRWFRKDSFIGKMAGKVLKSPLEVATRGGIRQAFMEMANPNATGSALAAYNTLDPRMQASLRAARGFRGLGIAAISVGATQAGFSIAKATLDGFASVGMQARMLDESKNPMAGHGFMDTRAAHTSRQRAMRAIQSSGGGLRRALGNEAQFQHWAR